jgi:hypothetical protein
MKEREGRRNQLLDEQRQAAQILKDAIHPLPDLPETEPDGEAKPALSDSDFGG